MAVLRECLQYAGRYSGSFEVRGADRVSRNAPLFLWRCLNRPFRRVYRATQVYRPEADYKHELFTYTPLLRVEPADTAAVIPPCVPTKFPQRGGHHPYDGPPPPDGPGRRLLESTARVMA